MQEPKAAAAPFVRVRSRPVITMLVVAVYATVTTVVFWPALSAGFLADDLFQISMIDGLFGEYTPLGLYNFAFDDPAATAEHIRRGTLPWWTQLHWRFSMLRPMSSLLLALDHWAFPRDGFAHHVHSLFWFFGCLGSIYLFVARGVGRTVAIVAASLFIIDQTNAWMVAWLANRCAMVSTVFAVLAIAVHITGRRGDGPRGFRWIEGALWGLAFAGGEYAACGLAYLFSWELLCGPRDNRRVYDVVPALVPLFVFAAVHQGVGYGVSEAVTYIDPFSDPRQFLTSAADRIPRMLGEVWLDMPGESDHFWVRYESVGLSQWLMPVESKDLLFVAWRHGAFVSVVTVAVFGPIWLLVRRHLCDSEKRFMTASAVGSVVSLIPISAVPPAARSLMLANLGAAIWLALAFLGLARAWTRRPQPALWRRVALTLLLAGVAVQTVAVEYQWVRIQLGAFADSRQRYYTLYTNQEFASLDVEGKHVVVIAAPGLVTGIHGMSMMNLLGFELPATWHVLAMGQRPYLVRRRGRRTIELNSVGGAMHLSPQEALFRTPSRALQKGAEIDAGVFTAEVIRTRDDLGPDAVLFHFTRDLDADELVFVEMAPEGLVVFEIPAMGKTSVVKPPQLPTVTQRG